MSRSRLITNWSSIQSCPVRASNGSLYKPGGTRRGHDRQGVQWYSCPATALLKIRVVYNIWKPSGCRITQWGQLGEILGGVRFPWASSLLAADDFPICAGCQGQIAHNKKTNRILYFARNRAGHKACPVSGLLNIQEVSLCERLSGVVICSMQI